MRPMLAVRGTTVPSGPGWSHEVKWDGMRVLVRAGADGSLRVTSRNENDVTAAFPELAGIGAATGAREVLLDGELVAFEDGRPVFGALAERIHLRRRVAVERAAAASPATLLVFDLLALDEHPLVGLPLAERRGVLEALELTGGHWQVPPTYDDGDLLLQVTREQGLEGVVSKRLSSPYRPGQRSEDWLKFPHRPAHSFVVGGWRPQVGGTSLAAVLVGEPTVDGLVYRGRVGSGLAGRAAARLEALLTPGSESPFATEVPPEDAEGTVWVEPDTIVEVTSLGFTREGRLRQPAYVGTRADLRPADLLDQEVGDGE